MEDILSYAKVAAIVGAAFAIAIGSIAPAIAQGLVGSKACENVAKYPESQNKLFPIMITSLAIIETSTLVVTGLSAALLYYAYSH